MAQKASDVAFFVKSDAECIDKDVSRLLGKYLCGAANADEAELFERHLDECIACWTDVTNWTNLGLAKGD